MAPARTTARPAVPGRPAGPRHLDALDGIRAGAAGAVLLTHISGLTGYVLTGTPASWVLSRGDVGVPVFFMLSGLLLYRRWATAALTGEPAGPVTGYLWRRALRILPAYWAVVLIALPVLNPGPARDAWPWVQYLLLLQNYDAHPWWAGTGATGLAQVWSLAVEVSFYLVLPLLAAALAWFACRGGPPGDGGLTRRARRLLAGIATVAASSFGWIVLAHYPRPAVWFGATLPPLMIWFGAGMAVAVAVAWAEAEPGPDGPARQFCRSVAASGGMCTLIAGCAFAMACTRLTGPEFAGFPSVWQTEFKTALYTVIALAIITPAACQPLQAGGGTVALPARLLGSRWARFLGRISYGVFLWQLLAAYAVFAVLHLKTALAGASYSTVQAALIGVAIALLTVAAATMSYYLIERPAQRLGGYVRSSDAASRPMMTRQMIWGMPLVSHIAAGLLSPLRSRYSPTAPQADAASSRPGSSHGPDSHEPAGREPAGREPDDRR
jgi:peptidoglycan/LPS O-acetylase OafA/YrhL